MYGMPFRCTPCTVFGLNSNSLLPAIVLVSAETVVHKHNGSLHLEIEEQIFRVNVLLNL